MQERIRKHGVMGVIEISWNLYQMKTFCRWNNPAKFFCQNMYSSKDFTDQRMYKMKTQNLLTIIWKCNNWGFAYANVLTYEPFIRKILCLWKKNHVFFFIMVDMCYFSYFWDTIFLPFWSKIFICHKMFISSVIPFLELEAKCH